MKASELYKSHKSLSVIYKVKAPLGVLHSGSLLVMVDIVSYYNLNSSYPHVCSASPPLFIAGLLVSL